MVSVALARPTMLPASSAKKSAVGQGRVKPCVAGRTLAHPTSRPPATTSKDQAMATTPEPVFAEAGTDTSSATTTPVVRHPG